MRLLGRVSLHGLFGHAFDDEHDDQDQSQLVTLTGRCLVLRRDLERPARSDVACETFLHARAWDCSLYIILQASKKGGEGNDQW